MPEYIPFGYITVGEALDRLGREQFKSAWTGKERGSRRCLISLERWQESQHLPPPRGGGASGGNYRGIVLETKNVSVTRPETPSDPEYQEEFHASERYTGASLSLRRKLEAGGLDAVVLDPFTGDLHPISSSVWRRHDADLVIRDGLASIPGNHNAGHVLIREFGVSKERRRLPRAKIPEVVAALKAELESSRLTRPRQAQFVRRTFATYDITDRQMNEMLQQVPVVRGRPRKSSN